MPGTHVAHERAKGASASHERTRTLTPELPLLYPSPLLLLLPLLPPPLPLLPPVPPLSAAAVCCLSATVLSLFGF